MITEEQVMEYLEKYPGTVGRFLGRKTSAKKAAASRRNAKLGGRGKKRKPEGAEGAPG